MNDPSSVESVDVSVQRGSDGSTSPLNVAEPRFSDSTARRVRRVVVALLPPALVWAAVAFLAVSRSDADGDLHARAVHIVVPVVATLLLAAVLLTRAYLGDTRSFWLLSYAASLVFIMAILSVWIALQVEPWRPYADETPVRTQAELDAFVRDRHAWAAAHPGTPPPVFIPTGVYLGTTEFKGTENVVRTGYIWQTYTQGLHDGLTRGFVLPDGVEVDVVEAYRRRDGGSERIGWRFTAESRKAFLYDAFPFDTHDSSLRLSHADFDRNAILVPDLNAYVTTDPDRLPGLKADFVLPGWTLEQTYFSFRPNRYTTDFGIDGFHTQGPVPEFYYHVVAKRQFLSSFFIYVLPAVVMLVLIFVIVYNMPPRHLGGEGLYNISRICGTYLFILILTHVNLRQQVSGGIVYLEYFYAVLYCGILWVLVNAALYLKGLNPPGIRWRENLIARVAFLPLMTGAMFLVTVLTFRG